jgi:WD40 repeat protein
MLQASIIDAFSSLTDRITAIRFSDDGELLVLGSATGVVHIWFAAQLRSVGTHSTETGTVSEASEIKDLHVSDVDSQGSTVQIAATTDGGACHVLVVTLTPSYTAPTACKFKDTCSLSKPSFLQNGAAKHCRCFPSDVCCVIV